MRILVLTTDPLTDKMPGPAIRAWHLAEVLTRSPAHQVTLVSTEAATRTHPGMDVSHADEADLERLERWMDVIVGPGSLIRRYPLFAHSAKPVVIDLYDPYHLENLEPDGSADDQERAANIAHLTSVINDDLRRGDYFICASVRQRDFWLGSLAAMGRVNPYNYDSDPTLGHLIGVVPFGLPEDPPVRSGPGIRGNIGGIGPNDPVVVWGGGVYNWFDPATVVSAIDIAREAIPSIRLVFLGMRNPNPHIPEMRVAAEVRALSDRLGLTGTHVFFNDGWVPYDQRADYLLDADIAVSTHLDHIETRFAFRTRVLDYLWAGLPMILTGGDSLAEMLSAAGLAGEVAPGDADAVASEMVRLLASPRPPKATATLAIFAHRFSWSAAAGPLVDFCSAPGRAPDLVVNSLASVPNNSSPASPTDRAGGAAGDRIVAYRVLAARLSRLARNPRHAMHALGRRLRRDP